METLITIVGWIFVWWGGYTLIFVDGIGYKIAGVVIAASGAFAHNQHSVVPLIVGFGVFLALKNPRIVGFGVLWVKLKLMGFDRTKDNVINNCSKTLDDCIYYLVNEAPKKDSHSEIARIGNTIQHFVREIALGKATYNSVDAQFTRLKNNRMMERGLTSHRDVEFSGFYIVLCFFLFLGNSKNKSSRIGANKILAMCENAAETETKEAVLEMTGQFRKIFNGD